MMLTLEEAIKHCDEVAEEKENEGKLLCQSECASVGCLTCAEEHRQLADWLTTLKEIWDSGSCNDCKFNGHCEIQPKLGQLVRFNCYHFSREYEEVNADED